MRAGRTKKEMESYYKEKTREEQRLEQFKNDPAKDMHDVKKQVPRAPL